MTYLLWLLLQAAIIIAAFHYRLIKTFDKSISCIYLPNALRFCSESYWPLFR
jgi:hypothetical protein